MAFQYLNLPLNNGRLLVNNSDIYAYIKEELEEFLIYEDYMNNLEFAKKVMFFQEVKSNNTVEGIIGDLSIIEDVIKTSVSEVINDEERKRIINLYHGYEYILNHNKIDEKGLYELYRILSDKLLSKEDILKMGDKYRNKEVYILLNGRLDTQLDQGIDASEIEKHMKYYFDYINDLELSSSLTDYFVKSQIMHFYFVYIHPYFDVNGRTSRTLAMWYLLNKESYPFIIFNRAISFDTSYYDKSIIQAKERGNVSYFIKRMMENVKKELEKEMIMHQIKQSTQNKLESLDYQTLIYLLSMKEEMNALSFVSLYRRKNIYKSVKEIYEEMLLPLIEKRILEVVRTTNKEMFSEKNNEIYRFNPSSFDKSNPKIKRLNISNK